MRRTALKRSTPLKRRTRIKPKRAKVRRSSRSRDRAYLLFVKHLPCSAFVYGNAPALGCDGPVEAHHAGYRGLGQKSSDYEAIPLCRKHHGAWHGGVSPFFAWGKGLRRAWAAHVISQCLAAYEGRIS